MTPAARLAAALAALPQGAPQRIGVAVSGGGDSMALLHLLADWARGHPCDLAVVTVDHGLRPEAAEEAALVQQTARNLSLPHDILRWTDADGDSGNLAARARTARLDLIAGWARQRGIPQVALAHTRDDQAETVLLRLARGSGVDGLSAMAPSRPDAARGVTWLRPLLQVRRDELRDELTRRDQPWAEDPSNADRRFDRVRARALLADPPLPGLEVDRLAETATRMAAARAVLADLAVTAAERLAGSEAGVLHLDAAGLAGLPDETRWRLLSGALCTLAGTAYRPRLSALQQAEAQATAGRVATLHDCLLVPARGRLWITREPAALAPEPLPVGLWDGRWKIEGAFDPEITVAPLGEPGLARFPQWREMGLPFAVAQALPGLWWDGDLLAAPAVPGARTGAPQWRATAQSRVSAFAAVLKPD